MTPQPRSRAAGGPPRPPVLFFTGAGLTAAVALRSIAELRKSFDVTTAAVGDAWVPDTGPPSAQATVDGALAWLDACAADQVHVIGHSYGGMIAQEIAILRPGRVRSLVLCATSGGGPLYVAPEGAIHDFVRRFDDLPVEEGLWASVPYLYTATTRREHAPRIGEDIARRLSDPLDPGAVRRQRSMAQAHDAAAALSEITAPTLIIHGEQDRLFPVRNGRHLADTIAGAELITLPDGGHAFPTDVPDSALELVRFLRAHSRPRRGSTASRSSRAARA